VRTVGPGTDVRGDITGDEISNLADRPADVESNDVPATTVEMKLSEMSYQAALAAMSRAIQPSLIDWLR
jgi:flagellar hook-associated protein 3 FlgL